ncbi:MAG: eL32 family ribosomal protein [Candidatus Pacearchaeota archaeon]
MKRKFLRRGTTYYIRLGKRQKKKQKWRRQRGRHSKIRVRKKGRLKKVQIGFGKSKKNKFLLKGKLPILVNNIYDLKKVDKEKNIVIISSKIGKKKRKQIIEEAKNKNIEILNIKKGEKNES